MDTKDKILSAAWTVLKEYGYTAATIKCVAETAAVGEASLYRLFRDKKGLFREVLHRFRAKPSDVDFAQIDDGNGVAGNLGLLFQQYLQIYARQMPILILAIHEEESRMLGIALSDHTMTPFLNQLAKYLRDLHKKGFIGKVDFAETAWMVFAHLQQQALRHQEQIKRGEHRWIKKTANDLAGLLEHSLEKEESKVFVPFAQQHQQRVSELRENNICMVLEAFQRNDTLVVSELMEKAFLSKTTVGRIITQLLADGLLLDLGADSGASDERGRPPARYRLHAAHGYSINAQFLAGNMSVELRDLQNNLSAQVKEPLKPDLSFDGAMHLLEAACRRLLQDNGLAWGQIIGICLALQGPVDSETGAVLYSPLLHTWPRRAPVLTRVRAFVPESVPVYIDNEGVFITMGEQYYGQAAARRSAIVLEVGERLVSGILVEDRYSGGSYAVAREIAHIQLDETSDVLCICGSRGCFRALVNAARALELCTSGLVRFPRSVLARNQEAMTLDDVIWAYHREDPLAVYAMDDIARWFGLALSNLSIIYAPEVIILQGEYVKAGPKFLEQVQRYLVEGKYPLLRQLSPQLVYSSLSGRAGMLGAGKYAADQYVKYYAAQKRATG